MKHIGRRMVGTLALVLLASAAAERARAEDGKAAPAAPPKTSPADLSSLLEPVRAKNDVPALAAVVITSKGIVAEGAVGVRKRGAKAKVTLEDHWHLGSCTKPMTATLIGRLVEQKKLRFDMTLAEAFPDLADAMHKDWKGVTLELLLRNRGGMPADLRRDGLWARLYAHKGTPVEARRLLTSTVLAWPPKHKPDTTYEYSNAGFAVVGHAAESLLKKPYEELLVEELMAPLGAAPLGFGPPGVGAKTITQPWGHAFSAAGRPPVDPATLGADNPPGITPAGRVHMPIRAWARFIGLHLAGGQPGKEKLLLSRKTLAHLQTPRTGEAYALGWATMQRPWAGGPVLMHNGTNTMWFCVTWIAPKRDFAILVTCNQGGGPGNLATDQATVACLDWIAKQGRAAGR